MMDRMAGGALVALCCWTGAAMPGNVEQNQAQLDRLQRRIKDLQQNLKTELNQRDALEAQLERGEQAIAVLHREISQTRTELRERNRRLQALQQRAAAQRRDLAQQRQQLVQLVRAKYMSGRHEPLKLLLNQQDPAAIGRMFTYYEYFSQARARRLAQIEADMAALDRSKAELRAAQQELQGLAAAQTERRGRLETQRAQRRLLLAKFNTRIAGDDEKLRRLRADAEHLRKLLDRLQRELADMPSNAAGFQNMRGRMALPVQAAIRARFGQPRAVPGTYWRGLFFRAAAGTPVRAIHRGRVVYADWLRGFGLLLIIDHGQGYMSLYSHNQEVMKGVGATVATGETVALVGDSGGLAQSGLYFELRHNGTPQDPLRWCKLR